MGQSINDGGPTLITASAGYCNIIVFLQVAIEHKYSEFLGSNLSVNSLAWNIYESENKK
jgi:hypothetical protein